MSSWDRLATALNVRGFRVEVSRSSCSKLAELALLATDLEQNRVSALKHIYWLGWVDPIKISLSESLELLI